MASFSCVISDDGEGEKVRREKVRRVTTGQRFTKLARFCLNKFESAPREKSTIVSETRAEIESKQDFTEWVLLTI